MSSVKAFFEQIMDALKTPFGVAIEGIRIFPDSLVLGLAVLSLISLNKSYALLLLGMFELMGVQRLLGGFFSGIAPVEPGSGSYQWVCQPGFVFPNTKRISLLETVGRPSAFPSPVMFFIAGVTAYMVAALQEFEKELNSLGADLNTRSKFALILSGVLIMAVFVMRITYGCETFGTIFISLIIGLFAGWGSFSLHKAFFGRGGVNVLSLPLIQTMDERGKPLFICAPS